MKKIKLAELNESVRSFVDESLTGGGIDIEDESGRTRGRLIPFRRATAAEREAARQRLQQIQEETQRKMTADGRSEAELDAILQEDE